MALLTTGALLRDSIFPCLQALEGACSLASVASWAGLCRNMSINLAISPAAPASCLALAYWSAASKWTSPIGAWIVWMHRNLP